MHIVGQNSSWFLQSITNIIEEISMHKVLYGNGISENLLHYKLSLMKEILYQASVEKCCGLVLFHSASPLP